MNEKAKQLRKFLVNHANICGGKTVLFFFRKSDKPERPLGPPVKVSFGEMAVIKENYQYGHSVYAKKLTDSFCEKIIRLSRDLEINVFFSIPALVKNTRKHDDIIGLGCAFLDDVPANTLTEDMLLKGTVIGGFPFPVSTIIQTSPGNCQVLWNFNGFLPVDDRYQGPQPPFLPAAPKHRKELFGRVLSLLKKELEGDPGGSNLNQIYRLPYTFNHKYCPAPEVEIFYSDFSAAGRIEFSDFYAELLMPEIKKHYGDNFPEVFTAARKKNDWILFENLLGWGESAEDIGRAWTANERDLSAAKRLYEYYKTPREITIKILMQSPNRQKGQDKGEQYFDSLFKKLNALPEEQKGGAISLYRRSTFDLLRVFGEAGALLFSRQTNVTIRLPVESGIVEVSRSGWGMTRQRAKVLMWALSEAMVWLNEEGTRVHLNRIIDLPFDDFAEKVMSIKENDFNTRREYLWTAYKTFDRLHKPMVHLRFGIGNYYDLSSGSKGISPFSEFKRTEDGRVIIKLSAEMEEALDDPSHLKRISNKVLNLIDHVKEPLTLPLLLWIGEIFFNMKNANADVPISSNELMQRLQGKPGKISERMSQRFRDKIYKTVNEINDNNLLELVGTNARKLDVTGNREGTEFKFNVSKFNKKQMELSAR